MLDARDWRWVRQLLPLLAGVPVAVLYALLAFLVMSMRGTPDFLETMTIGFLFLVPMVMGALTVWLSPPEARRSTRYVVIAPWVSVIVTAVAVTVLALEAFICVLIALPIFIVLSSLGGLLLKKRTPGTGRESAQTYSILFLVMLPYLVTSVETRLPRPQQVSTVESRIYIEADVDTVWAEIATVPLIDEDEQSFRIAHALGMPRPLEATLSHAGVGGVRHARFEKGLTFIETVTLWEPGEQLGFEIRRDRQVILPRPLEQIGGDYFDVLEGKYRIEPLADGGVLLHLSSNHRLSTRFNFYGRIWTEYFMNDLQMYILEIVKARAEQRFAPSR